jgi:hypothetical protein
MDWQGVLWLVVFQVYNLGVVDKFLICDET